MLLGSVFNGRKPVKDVKSLLVILSLIQSIHAFFGSEGCLAALIQQLRVGIKERSRMLPGYSFEECIEQCNVHCDLVAKLTDILWFPCESLPNSLNSFTQSPVARIQLAIFAQCLFHLIKYTSTAAGNFLQVRLLLVVELTFRHADIGILEDNCELSNPVPSNSQQMPTIRLGNALVRYVFKLVWSTNKLLADLDGQLEYRNEVADAESEADPGLCSVTELQARWNRKGDICVGILEA